MIEVTTELLDVLNHYEGVLPKYLLYFVDITEYNRNLERLGLYDKVYDEYYRIRIERKKSDDPTRYDDDEFDEWLKKNPKIRKLLE